MKYNFLVSVNHSAWIPGQKNVFVADFFIYKYLKDNNILSKFEDIIVADPIISNEAELRQSHEFVNGKYEKYVVALADKLNEIHGRAYSLFFWKKALSLGILRYITLADQIFQLGERYYKPESHICNILSEDSFTIPLDFNHNREFFQYTSLGQEQLFSIYMQLFYPGLSKKYIIDQNESPIFQQKKSKIGDKISRVNVRKFKQKLKYVLATTTLKIYHKLNIQPQLAIMGCFFSNSNRIDLLNRGKGKIIEIDSIRPSLAAVEINTKKRTLLSKTRNDDDRFDIFFWKSLEYGMPKEFVENFKEIESYYVQLVNRTPSLKYVICETWIGDTYSSIALAFLQEKGVKHIYNEHNYLSHQFVGKNNRYIFPLVDIFISLGWSDTSHPNLYKGGSLYEWVVEGDFQKKSYEILFIDGLAMVKSPEHNSAYGDSGAASSKRYRDFNLMFFSNLSDETLRKITFKSYPVEEWAVSKISPPMVAYDYNKSDLKPYLKKCKSVYDKFVNSKELIAKSKLVVINYLSTSYIESLMANVPTVIFWNKENYYLESEHSEFYQELVNVGICQTNPVNAAKFIENIHNDPNAWWQSASVQNARQKFIDNNLGSSESTKKYLLELVA